MDTENETPSGTQVTSPDVLEERGGGALAARSACDEEILNTQEVCARLKTSRSGLLRLVRGGELEQWREGRGGTPALYHRDHIADYIARKKAEATKKRRALARTRRMLEGNGGAADDDS